MAETVIWNAEVQTSDVTWSNASPTGARLFRAYIKNASITDNATRIKLSFTAHSTIASQIDGVAIGPKKAASDPYDYADVGTIQNIQQGASDIITLTAGDVVESDEVNFTINSGTDYIVACYFADNGGAGRDFGYLSGSTEQAIKNAVDVDETEIRDVTGYSENNFIGPIYQIISITGETPSPRTNIQGPLMGPLGGPV